MVYFGKKQGGGTPSANTATKDGNNVFTGTNTFNNAITTPGISTSNNADLTISANGTGRIQVQKDIVMNSHHIADLAEPASGGDAATKNYVDGIIKQKEILLSTSQWKNTLPNNKVRVYGWTDRLSTAQKNNVLGVELFVNADWDSRNYENSYICTYANYNGEFKVFVSRYDGQNITDATLDACTIKIRYVENITTIN